MSLKFAYKNRDYLTHLRMYFFYNYPLPETEKKVTGRPLYKDSQLFQSLEARLKTFGTWKGEIPAESLASAGFINRHLSDYYPGWIHKNRNISITLRNDVFLATVKYVVVAILLIFFFSFRNS